MNDPLRDDVLKTRKALVSGVMSVLAALVAVHVVPKSLAPYDPCRWWLMMAFFGSLLWLDLQGGRPWSNYQTALLAWRFQGAHERVVRSGRDLFAARERIMETVLGAVIPFLGATWIAALRRWHDGLNEVALLITLGWWVAFARLAHLPWRLKPLLDQEREVRRGFREQLARVSNDYQPRKVADLERNPVALPDPVRRSGRGFHAGGMVWEWEFLTANLAVFGESGAGKSLCVLGSLLEGLLSIRGQHGEPLSALILDPKGEYRGKIDVLCRRLNRAGDLIILDPVRPDRALPRWNPLDSDDDELEWAARFRAALETLGMKDKNSSLWITSAEKFIRSAVALLRLINPPRDPPRLHQIADLASSRSYLAECVAKLDENNPKADRCLEEFSGGWIELAQETRASIQMVVSNMIDPFRHEPYRSFFSGRSTLRIGTMLDQGKIIYVNMPTADRTEMARTVSAFVKLEFFREVLRRESKSRPSLFFCDEFQDAFTASEGKGDANFFDKSRSSNHVNVIGTQNLPNLIRHASSDLEVKSLLGVCATKIFLRNSEADTNAFASGLFGGREFVSTSESVSIGRGLTATPTRTQNRGDIKDQIIPPDEFVKLARPDRQECVGYCDSIVRLGSSRQTGPRRLRWPVHEISPLRPGLSRQWREIAAH